MRFGVFVFVRVLSICLYTSLGFAAEGATAAKAADLAWMSGRWETADGGLEENWTRPQPGSIASLVRIAKAGATDTIEMIVVAEERGSLTLRLRQWSLDYQPRTKGPQVMKLIELGKEKVVFEAINEGFVRKVGYHREGKTLFISAITTQGPLSIELAEKS
jgi:hypothetical protein